MPVLALGFLVGPSPGRLREQLAGAPGQVGGNRLALDLGLEPGQGDLGVAPVALAQELL